MHPQTLIAALPYLVALTTAAPVADMATLTSRAAETDAAGAWPSYCGPKLVPAANPGKPIEVTCELPAPPAVGAAGLLELLDPALCKVEQSSAAGEAIVCKTAPAKPVKARGEEDAAAASWPVVPLDVEEPPSSLEKEKRDGAPVIAKPTKITLPIPDSLLKKGTPIKLGDGKVIIPGTPGGAGGNPVAGEIGGSIGGYTFWVKWKPSQLEHLAKLPPKVITPAGINLARVG